MANHGVDDISISSLITSEMFEEMLLHRNDPDSPAMGFYTYDAFITATKSFPTFATTGDINTRKREIVAFFSQTSYATNGAWETAPDPYAWGYYVIEEVSEGEIYCEPNDRWPGVPRKQYHGRGPIQLSFNYNYGPCGVALGLDLLSNPDLVASDPVVSFQSALWFWMIPQPPKPSCHDVIVGRWIPTQADRRAQRFPGLGVTSNIIYGDRECLLEPDHFDAKSRIGYFKRYCDIFGIDYGDNLGCTNQIPF